MVLIEQMMGMSRKSLLTTFIFFYLAITTQNVWCQSTSIKNAQQQIGLNFDNNFFLFNGDDGYYTNGTFIKYSRIQRKISDKIIKRVLSVELGQKIFIAHSRKILPSPNLTPGVPGGIDQIDRPIAGYLFGKISQAKFYKNRTLLELGISAGSIGGNSLGQNVIEVWHQAIGIKDYWNWVWNYQVKNEFGINLHSTFAHSLLRQTSILQLTPITQATVGSTYTDVSQSFLFQIGKLRPMSSSSFWSSRLATKESAEENLGFELFIFYKPEIRYQIYNATIQGGMFSSDKGLVLSDINPIVLAHEFGVQFSRPRFSIRYSMTFQSKEAKSQFFNQSHASIGCSFSY